MLILLIITTPLRKVTYEYSAHFEKVTDQGYSAYNSTMPGLEYQIPELEYYNSDTQPKQYQKYQNLNVYLPPSPSTEDLHRWYGCGHRRDKCLELHSHRLYGEKTRLLESRIARKCKKNQWQRERRSADISLIVVILDIMYNASTKKRIYHPSQMCHS